MRYWSFNVGSAPSNLPITLRDLNERTACLMSMFALALSATGLNSLVIADFLRASKSWPQSERSFLATSSVIQDLAETAPMFLSGLSSSKFSLAQLDFTTCHGYAAGIVS